MMVLVLAALLGCGGTGPKCDGDSANCQEGDRTRVFLADGSVASGVDYRVTVTWAEGAVECLLGSDGSETCDPGAFLSTWEEGSRVRMGRIELDVAVQGPIEVVAEAEGVEVHRETVEMRLTPESGTTCHPCVQALGNANWP